jgi:hypothetical protein
MSTLSTSAVRAFARHETFHPRYGWLRKAVDAAVNTLDDQDAFTAEDSTVALGVGKNMVKAIRFWGQAAKLIRDEPVLGPKRKTVTRPTALGRYLFDADDGVDPYLELTGTIWLTHWWMLRPPSILPVWWIAFHRFTAIEFDEDALTRVVGEEIERANWKLPNASSVHKDIACILRMYVRDDSRASLDDLTDCPTRELGLLVRAQGDASRYRFNQGPKPSLPDLVVLHASLEWLARRGGGASVGVAALATSPGGPGLAFRMSARELTETLERATAQQQNAGVSSVAGRPSLFTTTAPADAAWDALDSYYSANGRTPRSADVRREATGGSTT